MLKQELFIFKVLIIPYVYKQFITYYYLLFLMYINNLLLIITYVYKQFITYYYLLFLMYINNLLNATALKL